MQVLYIDVYFFLNFTIDVLSLFFAAKFLHIKTSFRRLILIGTLGAVSAILDVLMSSNTFLRIIFSIVFLLLASFFITTKIRLKRRLKFIFFFFITEMLLGGLVNFVFSMLDRYSLMLKECFDGGSANRKALIISIIILFAIGVLKIFIMLFSGQSSIKSAVIKLYIDEKCFESEALIDSGNLVKDPIGMCPVMFVTEKLAGEILPREIINLENLDCLECHFRKRIRLIPVTRGGETHVMTGVKFDKIEVLTKDNQYNIDVTVAIDKFEGEFGGYDCLIPSCVTEND